MGRFEFFESIRNKYSLPELRHIQTAYFLAKNLHRPQKRDDGERYFEHPVRVAKILLEFDYDNYETIVLALLHDVIEDTYTPEHMIIDLFGQEIYKGLNVLTKSKAILDPLTLEMTYKAKKELHIYFSEIAATKKNIRVVKLADRIDNIRDLNSFTPERKAKYIKETVEYILPIAQETDPQIEKRIVKLLNEAGAGL